MAGNGRDIDPPLGPPGPPSGSATPMGRFARLAERLRPHRLAPDPPPPPPPDVAAVAAAALAPWVNEPPFAASFLPELDARIRFANGCVTSSILEVKGDATTHFAVGYEAALRDMRAAFLAWRNGQPAPGPTTGK